VSTTQRFRIAKLIAKRERRVKSAQETQVLILMYRRHEAWARRSGYAPMEWEDFKRSRLENPLSRAFIAKAAGSQS
jgi:hypothetical protein